MRLCTAMMRLDEFMLHRCIDPWSLDFKLCNECRCNNKHTYIFEGGSDIKQCELISQANFRFKALKVGIK